MYVWRRLCQCEAEEQAGGHSLAIVEAGVLGLAGIEDVSFAWGRLSLLDSVG